MRDNYRAIGGKASKSGTEIQLTCKSCGQTFVLKSNVAVVEEFERQSKPFIGSVLPGCKTENCINEGKPIDRHSKLYQSFGRSGAGSQRYRCKACAKTFSVHQSATWRQRRPELSEVILRLLVNKMPMRRICEAASVEPAVLYNRIDYIYKQCVHFAVAREKALQGGMPFKQLRIAVDRQDHTLNWASQDDRRNTKLSAVGSADCDTGYVFGFELDYDPDLNPYEVDLHASELGDYALAPPFRRYARVFLPGIYRTEKHIEVPILDANAKLPGSGMRIHPEYALMGHFMFLKWLLPGAQSIHFYLDQEPSIRAACVSAFKDMVTDGYLEAFFVQIAKDMTVDEKKLEIAHSETFLLKLKERYPNLNKRQIAFEIMKSRYLEARNTHSNPMNRWVECVLPNMGEPKKKILYITDRGGAEPDYVAVAMMNASLHPLDRFFMQIRRRVSLLERPISSASSAGRVWHGYSGYNPYVVQKIMSLFRVIYNYCLIGKDGKTPAMRLGLAEQPVSYGEILTFI